MVRTCNLGAWKTDAGGSEIQDHLKLELNPGLHMTLTQTTTNPTKWPSWFMLRGRVPTIPFMRIIVSWGGWLCLYSPSEGGDVGSTSWTSVLRVRNSRVQQSRACPVCVTWGLNAKRSSSTVNIHMRSEGGDKFARNIITKSIMCWCIFVHTHNAHTPLPT